MHAHMHIPVHTPMQTPMHIPMHFPMNTPMNTPMHIPVYSLTRFLRLPTSESGGSIRLDEQRILCATLAEIIFINAGIPNVASNFANIFELGRIC